MAKSITRNNLFQQMIRTPATAKAVMTDDAVRKIVEVETADRDAKTARLRKARLEFEAREASSPDPVKSRPARGVQKRVP